MKMLLNNAQLLFCLLLISLQGCGQTGNSIAKMKTYDEYRTQRIEPRDSLFILHTVREWGKEMWSTWAVRTDMYKMTSNDVEYFLGGGFYSPDKKKILVWVGEKMPNATSREMTRSEPKLNRICPTGGDTIYSLSALIGIRDNANQIWKLYPFNQQQVTCSDTKSKAINILGQYYFEKMKTHEMYRMMQEGKRKGHKELQAYGYNLQDKDFWDKCWLFQKDTVGSNGLYPFQLKGYNYKGEKCDAKCAEPYNPPVINYPEEILKLFK
jgi:hypothetical protein